MRDLFFISDIETNGEIPGDNSMMTLASVVVAPRSLPMGGQQLARTTGESFYGRMFALPGSKPSPDAKDWWSRQSPEAYHEAFIATPRYAPEIMMHRYEQWVDTVVASHGGDVRPVFVSKPTGFDFTFVRWYLIHHLGQCVFGHRALDVRSLVMGMRPSANFSDSETSNLIAEFGEPRPEDSTPHHALSDARELASIFVNILNSRMEVQK